MTDPTRKVDVHEAVAVFKDADALYAAIDELQMAGVSRADISVLAGEEAVEEKIGTAFWSAEKLEDEPDAPRSSYVSEESVGAAEGVLIGGPLYVAAVATVGAIMTPAGSMLTAVAAAVLAGGAGAALGALLARLVGDQHAEYLQNQIAHGGLLLWVRTPDPKKGAKAVEILKRNSGRDVHVHGWSVME